MNISEVYFPHDVVRDEQKKLVVSVLDAIERKKVLLAHAPTGLGKTAAALAPALSYALKNKLTVFFLTSRHTQHAIAIRTLKEIKKKHNVSVEVVDLIGKKNMCLQPGVELLRSGEFSEYCKAVRESGKCEYYTRARQGNKLSVDAKKTIDELKNIGPCHTEELIQVSKRDGVCPYEIAVGMAHTASVIVADYNYIFNDSIRKPFLQKIDKELGSCIIIVDEAHNVHERVKSLASETISSITLQRAIKEAQKFGSKETVGYLAGIQDILNEFGNELHERNYEKFISQEEFYKKVNAIKDYSEIMSDLYFIADTVREAQKQSSIGSIAKFLEHWQGPDEGFVRILSFNRSKQKPVLTLAYNCLDPSLVARPTIQNTHSMILMSATLSPAQMYADLLGIDDPIIESFQNPFPVTNKLTLIIPETTTKFSERNEDQFTKIATITSNIANLIPGNTAIFFPSYDLRDKIYKYFFSKCKKTIFLEVPKMQKNEKTELLERFAEYKEYGAVLLAVASGSFGEGIDLPGVLKCVIVVGLPLQQPDLETKKLIMYYDEKFGKGWDYGYTLPAIAKCMQSAGRCIRSEKDRGVIIFLDERFAWQNYKACFPDDWDIKVTKLYEGRITEFFKEEIDANKKES